MQTQDHFESSIVMSQGASNQKNGNLIRRRLEKINHLAKALMADIRELEIHQSIELSSSKNVIDFYAVLRDFEILLITKALERTHGSQVKAAKLLTMNLTTLNSKIKSYKIPIRDL